MTKQPSTVAEIARVEEAAYWGAKAADRTRGGAIPLEADRRRATRVMPATGVHPVDPCIAEILDGRERDLFIRSLSHVEGGKVLDIGCGPGWLALELGRSGQHVLAFDLSPGAIAIAQRLLSENPYRAGFGSVTYTACDVTGVDLGTEQFDAVSGWSAFHHLPDLERFMERVNQALKPGGIVATMDDYPAGRLETAISRACLLLLPRALEPYRSKAKRFFGRFIGQAISASASSSPMEATSTLDVAPLFYRFFDVVEDRRYNAFAAQTAQYVAGPDWFRHLVARLLKRTDAVLCRARITKGTYRLIIARKKR